MIDWNVLKGNPDQVVQEDIRKQDIPSAPMQNPSQPHLPCLILLDTSSSMRANNKLNELQDALNVLKQTLMEDKLSRERVEICVITFNSKAEIVTPFCAVDQFVPPQLQTSGMTFMATGIRYALEVVHNRITDYMRAGVRYYKPFIMMITDGEPNEDMTGIADLIAVRGADKRYGAPRFHAFGVSGADMALLGSLTQRVWQVSDHCFDGIFNWLSKSLQLISRSSPIQDAAAPEPGAGFYPWN